MDLGQRIRDLRHARHIPIDKAGMSRGHLSRLECNHQSASLEMVERLSDLFDIGVETLLGSDERFSGMLLFEDGFVKAVLPYLKQLSEQQKKEILITVAAAPVQPLPNRMGRPRSAPIEKATSNGLKNSTEGRVSTTFFQTSRTQFLPLAVSRKTVKRSALHS